MPVETDKWKLELVSVKNKNTCGLPKKNWIGKHLVQVA
jgi:hypothetical protein